MVMNSSVTCDAINTQLTKLAFEIKTNGQLNLLHYNIHAEYLFARLLRLIYAWELVNANQNSSNYESIDLVCHDPIKLVIQVSATCNKAKIQSSLNGDTLVNYKSYNFKFLSLNNDSANVRKMKFGIPGHVIFDPKEDILDIPSLMKNILPLEIGKKQEILDFLKSELDSPVNLKNLDRNLASIVNMIGQQNFLELQTDLRQKVKFEIEEKITKNKLVRNLENIRDYSVYSVKLDAVYSSFDAEGSNRSLSVLSSIRKIYLNEKDALVGDLLFDFIVNGVKNQVIESPNFVRIPEEELVDCIFVIVVHAFIKCKIFEHPGRLSDVVT